MVDRLKDKVVLVTGAAQGQGAAHIELLAREGAHVVATDVLDESGTEVAQRLASDGLKVVYRHLDVAAEQDWAAVVKETTDSVGAIDVLVNNAGITSPADVGGITQQEWDRVVAINQTGILLGMQAVLPAMKEKSAGSIINIASLWAHRGGTEDGFIAYVASKAAVLGMTKNAAMNLGRTGIRVNSISPGYVRTPQIEFAEQNEPDRVAKDLAKIPMRRMARPDEISGAVLFLASDDSSYVTGVDLLVDGGISLT